MPGERIGPYEVVRRIGTGGMGVVFEAADTILRRPVAVKVISPHLAGDPAFRARFTREAQAQASLDSPHVVQVFAHGEDDGALYIATQLIPDGDLGAMIRSSGTPSPAIALDLIAQVATGLADAHAAGLVHGDIKPANVLVRRRGEEVSAYLTDFGIARRADEEPALSRSPGPQGSAAGTPSYMAPELHTGGAPGVASDVYALGCLLWTVLTGSAPYAGSTDDQLISAHVSSPVPQLAAVGLFEQAVNAVVRRAMAKDPGQRYPSAGALRDDLLEILHDHPATSRSRPVLRALPRGRALSQLAVLLIGLGLGLGLALRGLDDDRTIVTKQHGLTADEQEAADNIATALVDDADFERPAAMCTARNLATRAGIDGLVAQGVVDEHLDFVADDHDAIDPAVLADIIAVGVACVFGPPA